MSHTPDVAHVEGNSGTFVLPIHSPYDRQLLREHVDKLAGRAGTLTLGVSGLRWTVTRPAAMDLRCISCTQFLGRLSCSRGDKTATTCIDCAMQPEKQHTEGRDA